MNTEGITDVGRMRLSSRVWDRKRGRVLARSKKGALRRGGESEARKGLRQPAQLSGPQERYHGVGWVGRGQCQKVDGERPNSAFVLWPSGQRQGKVAKH